MKLLVLRHDVAEPRDPTAGQDADAQRSLTDDGRKRARRAASALVRLVEKLDVLGSSGLRRADQTAEVLAAALGGVDVRRVEALRPGADPQALVSWLRGLDGAQSVGIVGHDPALSAFVTWLVSGLSTPWLELGKGGACLLEISGRIAPGEARLVWLLRPDQLRRLR